MQGLELTVAPMFQPVLQYELAPRGLIAPEPKRIVKPDKICELETIFEEWLSNSTQKGLKGYWTAERLLKNLKFSADEVNAFLITNQERLTFWGDTLFVSALYNNLSDKVIVYNLKLNTPLKDYVGFKLPKDKVLVVTENIGSCLGDEAKGVIIVAGNAKIGTFAGADSEDLVIFTGNCKASENTAHSAKGTVIVGENAELNLLLSNLSFHEFYITGNAKTLEDPNKRITSAKYHDLREQKFNIGIKLNNYLISLNKMFTGSSTEIAKSIALLGENPAYRIKQDIAVILKEGGYNV